MARFRDTIADLAADAVVSLVDWADSRDLLKAKGDVEPDEGNDRGPGGDSADSPDNAPMVTEKATDDPKTMFWDPFAIIEQLGYKEKPTQVSYGTLRAIVWKTPIIHTIVQRRVNQIAGFSTPQHDRYKMGYRVKLRDSEKEPSKAAKRWIQQAETFLMRTGVTDNPRGRDTFETFLRKIVWDSLTYDQMTWEIVPNRKGQPAEFYAVDASTIRLADTVKTFRDEDDTDPRYVQIYDGLIINEYTQEELAFGVRNPKTDIRLHGYGVSEIEMLISAITSILYAWEYNSRFFSQGSAVKGMINFKGAIPQAQLRAFRRHFYNMISSVENAWRTPIVNSDEVQWINMQTTNRDMEFSAWMDFLIKISCSMFNMDSAEINFQYGNGGQKTALQEASNREKITESKERGLRPLLRFIASQINQSLIWPISEDFEFEFMGLDAMTRDNMTDLAAKQVKVFKTVDEIRAEDDLAPLPDGKGECLLDPSWLQFAQMQEGGGEEGMPGEGGPEDAGGGGEDEFDFEAMLQGQGEEEPPGDSGNEPPEPAEPAKPAKGEETEKSLRRYSVDINL